VIEGKYIAVDFDGTLAEHGCNWPEDYCATGAPIPRMVERVKIWLAAGIDVRIFTARMDCYHPTTVLKEDMVKAPIEAWCKSHLGVVLPITNQKTHHCIAIYDDIARGVERDTGRLLEEEL